MAAVAAIMTRITMIAMKAMTITAVQVQAVVVGAVAVEVLVVTTMIMTKMKEAVVVMKMMTTMIHPDAAAMMIGMKTTITNPIFEQ